ncbi:MAG TPA: hypothetical protein VGE50_05470 [Gammaproteobacteria bacterium]
MIRKINIKLAANIFLLFSAAIILFHLLVMSGVVPYNIVWGGRLEDTQQMYVFESIAMAVNLAIAFVVCVKVGYLKPYLPKGVITVVLWGMVILFVLNTVGNLLAKTTLETLLFTPLTLISAVLFYRMAIER